MQIKHYPFDRYDIEHLKKMLARIPADAKRMLLFQYSVDFSKGYINEPMGHKKENAGRANANEKLRENVRYYMTEGVKPTWKVPQICGNCDHLKLDGRCAKFNEHVPDEYTVKENDCEHYINSIPF